MAKTAVIALGGGTILRPGERGTMAEQYENLAVTCARLVPLAAQGWNLVLTHGNGPQVGNIVLQNQHARALVEPMPLDVCGAQSQGQIGYLLQNVLENTLQAAGLTTPAAGVITRVRVDDGDPSFIAPEKAVGPIYTAARALDLNRLGVAVKEVGRGWRQVVPSPQPLQVLEVPLIRQLLGAGYIVIAGGGGGVPVVRGPEGLLRGVEAVVEKDLTTALLAAELAADLLVLLTHVPGVALEYGEAEEQTLPVMTVAEARRYAGERLPWGSMGVKVEAAARFVVQCGRPALITNVEALPGALERRGGTWIQP